MIVVTDDIDRSGRLRVSKASFGRVRWPDRFGPLKRGVTIENLKKEELNKAEMECRVARTNNSDLSPAGQSQTTAKRF